MQPHSGTPQPTPCPQGQRSGTRQGISEVWHSGKQMPALVGALKRMLSGRLGGSVSRASDFGSGHDLTVCEFEPRVGLCADRSEPGACFRFCVSLSLRSCPAHARSLSKINIKKDACPVHAHAHTRTRTHTHTHAHVHVDTIHKKPAASGEGVQPCGGRKTYFSLCIPLALFELF